MGQFQTYHFSKDGWLSPWCGHLPFHSLCEVQDRHQHQETVSKHDKTCETWFSLLLMLMVFAFRKTAENMQSRFLVRHSSQTLLDMYVAKCGSDPVGVLDPTADTSTGDALDPADDPEWAGPRVRYLGQNMHNCSHTLEHCYSAMLVFQHIVAGESGGHS